MFSLFDVYSHFSPYLGSRSIRVGSRGVLLPCSYGVSISQKKKKNFINPFNGLLKMKNYNTNLKRNFLYIISLL